MEHPLSPTLPGTGALWAAHTRSSDTIASGWSVRGLRKSKSYAAGLRDFVSAGVEEVISLGRGRLTRPVERTAAAQRDREKAGLEYEKNLRRGRMLRATTYEEFCLASAELDELEGVEEWKTGEDTGDHQRLKARVEDMEAALREGEPDKMLSLLRTSTHRNFAGLNNPSLYNRARLGTKRLIERYVRVVRETVEAILAAVEVDDIQRNERLFNIVKQLRQQSGRTALLLSGGGTLGMNHIGVIKALFEANLLPRVVSGTSAGSIVAAVLCTRSDEDASAALQDFCHHADLAVFVGPEEATGPLARCKYLLSHGHLYDPQNLARVMRHWLGDLTFAEAYKRSNRVLNIAVSTTGGSRGPFLLNVYSTPHVIIRSAVVASCSVPLIFPAAKLEFKSPVTGEIGIFRDDEHYVDGSLQGDIPVQDVRDQLGCDLFIVSQVNPHIRPWVREVEHKINNTLPQPFLMTCTDFLLAEASHQFDYVSRALPRPRLINDWVSIAQQRYVGDINILPTIDHSRVYGVLSNPTPEFMDFARLNGERATWKKMNQIRFTMAIERIFEDAVSNVHARLMLSSRAPSTTTLRLRMPELRGFASDAARQSPPRHKPMTPFANRDTTNSQQQHNSNLDDRDMEDIPASAEWLTIQSGRITYKASSLPGTPNATGKKFFSPSSTPRARSPATKSSSIDLTMTPTKQHYHRTSTEETRSDVSTPLPPAVESSNRAHRRVQSDLALFSYASNAGANKTFCNAVPVPTPSPTSSRPMAGRGRGRRRSRSRSRSRSSGRRLSLSAGSCGSLDRLSIP